MPPIKIFPDKTYNTSLVFNIGSKYNKIKINLRGVKVMAISNLVQVSEKINYTGAEAIQLLRSELEKGIESMERGSVYTLEEAWKEIDAN